MKRIHVVTGQLTEHAVRRAVNTIEPDAVIFSFRDPLDVGPLYDFDGTAATRAAFWKEIGVSPADWESEHAEDAMRWREIRRAKIPVVVWHGPHPTEYVLAVRSAAMLKGTTVELYEIVRREQSRHLPAFYGAVALATPEELISLVGTAVPVRDIEERATQWDALCGRDDVYFRELSASGLVELRADAYDHLLLGACGAKWKAVARVIGTVLGDLPAGDRVLAWRLRALLTASALQGRGTGPFGVAEVRRMPRRG